jgi:hypothetical protein
MHHRVCSLFTNQFIGTTGAFTGSLEIGARSGKRKVSTSLATRLLSH